MPFTTHLGQINTSLLQLFPPILKRSPLTNPKSPTKTSSKKCFKCLGFGHIAVDFPTKNTMMVKGGQVVSEHSENSVMIDG